MLLSKHAARRAVERCVPMDVLSMVCAYGTPFHSRGALRLVLDGEALDLAAGDLSDDRIRRLKHFRGSYAVEVGELVVTVVRPWKRKRRNRE